jgi:hypothetical protein
MSSYLHSGSATADERELLNLRRQLPHPLATPSSLPRAWRSHVMGTRGYTFGWGYLVEMPNALQDSSTPWAGDGTSWRLLPTTLWIEARARAHEAHYRWSRVVARVNRHSPTMLAEYVPDWLVCGSCAPCFLGEFIAVGERDAQRARCWLAGRFLTKQIDAVLGRYRDCLLESIAIIFDLRRHIASGEALATRLQQVTKRATAPRFVAAPAPTLH